MDNIFVYSWTIDDTDDTATDAIIKCKQLYPKSTIVFCNGGDRTDIRIYIHEAN